MQRLRQTARAEGAAGLSLCGEDRSFARRIHALFARRPGAEHIASARAIAWLSACLRAYRPRRVLEVGAGIGTLTFALLTHAAGVRQVVATERNRYCLDVLRNDRLFRGESRLTLVTCAEELARLDYRADLIVGDGGFDTQALAATAREGTAVFVEGERRKLRDALRETLAQRGLTLPLVNCGTRLLPGIRFRRAGGIPVPTICLLRKGCWLGVVGQADRARAAAAGRRQLVCSIAGPPEGLLATH